MQIQSNFHELFFNIFGTSFVTAQPASSDEMFEYAIFDKDFPNSRAFKNSLMDESSKRFTEIFNLCKDTDEDTFYAHTKNDIAEILETVGMNEDAITDVLDLPILSDLERG